MAEESHKTFFSYARADSEFVLRLVKDLRAAGADVWLDQLDIGPGEHWDSAVENALRISRRHVTVLSPEAVSSQNVMDEVSYALEEHKQVIPLLYRDCTVPFRLRRVQWVDFRTDYARGFRDLAKALGIKDAQSVRAQPVPPMERPQSPEGSRTPERPQMPLQISAPAGAGAQTSGVAGQPRRQTSTGEAIVQKETGQKVEQVRAAASQPHIWPEPKQKEKILWTVGAVVVLLTFVIWMLSAGNDHHDSGTGQAITPTVTPTPDNSQAAANNAQAFYQRGKGQYEKKQYDQAINALTQAIRLKPDYAESYNERGRAYDEKGEYNRAIQDYTQALKLNPNYTVAYYNRGIAYNNKGDSDRAIQDYTQALKLNPNDADVYYNRGLAYNNKGDYDRTIQDYTQALKLNPNDADAYNNRGVAYEGKKQYQQALQDYDRALQAGPNVKNARQNRERVAALLKEQGGR